MENNNDAVAALSGLAHLTRLDIFRLLVEAGSDGMSAGQIGERLGLAPTTLSFHLKNLKDAGLVDCQRESRSLIYLADFGQIAALVAYLTEQYCRGRRTHHFDKPNRQRANTNGLDRRRCSICSLPG